MKPQTKRESESAAPCAACRRLRWVLAYCTTMALILAYLLMR